MRLRLAALAFAAIAAVSPATPATAQEAPDREASRAADAARADADAAISAGLEDVAETLAARIADPELETAFDRWVAEARRARDVIAGGTASNAALEVMRSRLQGLRDEARKLAERQRAALDPLRREIDALGPVPEEGAVEETTISQLRARLEREIAEEQAVLAAAQLAVERFNVLLNDLNAFRRERLRARVMTRGPTPLDPSVWVAAAEDMARLGRDIESEARASLARGASRAQALERAPLAALALALSVAFLVIGKRRLSRWVRRIARNDGLPAGHKIAAAVAATLGRLALLMGAAFLFFFSLMGLGLFGLKVQALVEGAARGLLYVIVTYALATAYFAPEAPELRLAGLPDDAARKGRRAAMTLAWTVGLSIALVYSLNRLRFDPEALVVLQFLLSLLGAWGLLELRSALGAGVTPSSAAQAPAQTQEEEETPEESAAEDRVSLSAQFVWLLRHALLALAVAGPALSALGYFAASYELIGPSMRSLGVIGLCALLIAFARAIAAGFVDRAGRGGARFWRLAPALAGVIAAVLAVPLFAMAWGATWKDVIFAGSQILEGVDLGGMRLSPVAVLTFLLVFSVGYALTGLVKRVLRTSVLPELQVDVGARSALDSGVGYVGVILAALLAISAAGLDLSNLAIVAGALSVGVGFGLQTIVNNFVSGLILLIERPIRVGDWIEVNGVHGNVKRVNVRSTEIETFDRSDYIVPNSALISSPVTNYTRKNVLGRLIVKVGVAYASDPREVEKLLREAAAAHPMVLRRPAPAILFRAFGADALEFEIRAYLRDVNYILRVGSDLHFAVAEKFREHGVEIPFGQRDIWFRNVDEFAAAFRRDAADAAPVAPREAAPPETLRGAAE